jgi:uncharacterized membrane protein
MGAQIREQENPIPSRLLVFERRFLIFFFSFHSSIFYTCRVYVYSVAEDEPKWSCDQQWKTVKEQCGTLANSIGTVHYNAKSMCFAPIGGMTPVTVGHTGCSTTVCICRPRS